MGKSFKIGVIVVALALVVVVALVLFRDFGVVEEEPRYSSYTIDDKPMIGFSIDSTVIERWQKDISIVKTKAEELGFRVEIVNSYENADKQKEQIRTLVDEGAVALFVLPYDKDSLTEVLQYAKEEGVYVVSYDRLVTNAYVDAYVSFDNVAVGEFMAQALVNEIPQGNYVIVNGSPFDNNAYMFNEGFYNVLAPYVEDGAINIISEIWSDNWREEFGINEVRRLLSEGQEIDAVIGANDRLAEGVIGVLSEYGLVGEVLVVGHDADISACQKVVEGKQLMTVYKPIKNLAEGSVNLVYSLINQEAVETEDTINNGLMEVPFYKFDVIPVTADNMRETIIKDLFHSEEDVYRNVVDE